MKAFYLRRTGFFNLAIFLAVGCATLMYGTTQSIYIDSVPPGAHVTILPTGQTLTTPGRVELAKKRNYTVRVELEGYETQSLNIYRKNLHGGSLDRDFGGAYELVPPLLRAELRPVGVPSPRATPAATATPNTGPVPVTFFNASEPMYPHLVSIWIDQRQIGELGRYDYLTVQVEPGTYRLTVAHTDLFTFDNEYQVDIPRKPVFVEVYSMMFSTHYQLTNAAPEGFPAIYKQRPALIDKPVQPKPQ